MNNFMISTGLYEGYLDNLEIKNSIIEIESTTEELSNLTEELSNFIEINIDDINQQPDGIQAKLTATINKTNDIHTDIYNVNAGIIKKLNDVEITANDVYDEVNNEVDGVLKHLFELTERVTATEDIANANDTSINNILPPGLSLTQTANSETLTTHTASLASINFYLFTPPNPLMFIPVLNNILAAMTLATAAVATNLATSIVVANNIFLQLIMQKIKWVFSH